MMEDKIKNIKVTPEWKKTKEEIWNNSFAPLMEGTYKKKTFSFYASVYRTMAGIAAVVTLLFCFSFFYSKKYYVPRGKQMQISLPDGSSAKLNSETSISYKPAWWHISKQVKMDGEAYFSGIHGKNFSVKTANGTVHVLGTKFNVYNRANKYEVTCIDGKIEVSSGKEDAILKESMKTELNNKGLKTIPVDNVSKYIIWTTKGFSFSNTPLREVLEEIARRYDISISSPENINYLYTGQFSYTKNPQKILDVIGETYQIKLKVK